MYTSPVGTHKLKAMAPSDSSDGLYQTEASCDALAVSHLPYIWDRVIIMILLGVLFWSTSVTLERDVEPAYSSSQGYIVSEGVEDLFESDETWGFVIMRGLGLDGLYSMYMGVDKITKGISGLVSQSPKIGGSALLFWYSRPIARSICALWSLWASSSSMIRL